MKKIVFICILLYLTNAFKAQNRTIDSLKLVVKNSKIDTNLIINTNQLCRSLFSIGNYDSALVYAQQALAITNTITSSNSIVNLGFKRGKSNILNTIGIIYQGQSKYTEALEYQFASIKIKEELGDKKGIAYSYNNIGLVYYYQGNYNEALKNHLASLKIKQELNDKKGISYSNNNIAMIHFYQGNYPEALKNYYLALKLREELGDKMGIAACYVGIGAVYEHQKNFIDALKKYQDALKLQEEIANKLGISISNNNIGNIYFQQGKYQEALNYYKVALKLREEMGDKHAIAESYSNFGNIYFYQKEYNEALKNYLVSLKIHEDAGEKQGAAVVYGNIGATYLKLKNSTDAETYLLKSLNLCSELKNLEGILDANKNLSELYASTNRHDKALTSFQAYINARDSLLNEESTKKTIQMQMGYVFEKKQDSTRLEAEKKELALQKEIQLQQLTFEFKRKQALAKTEEEKKQLQFEEQLKRQQIENEHNQKEARVIAEHEQSKILSAAKQQKDRELAAAKLDRQKTITLITGIGVVLLLLLLVFIFNRFKVTQKQKKIIENKEQETQLQKQIIEEKHKEITDSINYAERIQRSFLATKELLDENLSSPRGGAEGGGGYFVFFKPKDVVSGDFYWSAKLSNGNFALATADSTGHGVPGAIMSLLNVTSLEKAIEHHTNPAEILNHTRQTIIERLKKDGSEEGGKDGMDCSLLVFDFVSPFEGGAQRAGDVAAILYIAAANNPVWIIRSVSTSAILSGVEGQVENKYELIEIKPDKMPVGKSERQNESFTLQTIELQKGDTIYTLTDGFPDQFGGDKGKKFMSKKLKELLVANVHLPINQQKELLDATFKNWLGNLEQVDDVTVIGIKI